MPSTTDTATHVYIRKENPKGLMPAYWGPHKIVDRPSHSTVKVKVGTFVNGADNVQLHHWSNLKPAEMRSDTPLAEMPKRGRPPKVTVPTESKQSIGSEDVKKDAPTKVNKEPTRRSERIRNKNHETSSVERQDITPGGKIQIASTQITTAAELKITGPPPLPGFPTRKTWSASVSDLAAINKSINLRHKGA